MARWDEVTFSGHHGCFLASGWWLPSTLFAEGVAFPQYQRSGAVQSDPSSFSLKQLSYGPQAFQALKLMFGKHKGCYSWDRLRSVISTAAVFLILSNPLLCARASDANCLQQITWLPPGCTSSCLLSLRRMWGCRVAAAGLARSRSTVWKMFCE